MATRTRKTKKAADFDPRAALIEAALERAQQDGWRGATLRDLSEAAAVPFADVYEAFRTPAHVPASVLGDAVDVALGEPLPDGSLAVKDRVFDAAMNVFDALRDRRAGLGGMLDIYGARALSGAPVWRALARFARVSLERAGVPTDGAAGAARVAALSRTLWLVLKVFAEDDDGLSRTMAALDTRLREAERWAKRLGWDRAA